MKDKQTVTLALSVCTALTLAGFFQDIPVQPSYTIIKDYNFPNEPTGTQTMPTNLGDIPDDYSLTYGPDPQIISTSSFAKTTGNTSITIAPHVDGVDVNVDRECDGTWLPVSPGDRIIASCWIYTGASSLGDESAPYAGCRLGIDLYGHTSVGFQIVRGFPDDGPMHTASVVQWGQNAWVKKKWDFIVPDTYYTSRGTSSFNPCQIDYFVLWLDVRERDDSGSNYFSDGELYIYSGNLSQLASGYKRLYTSALGSGTTNLGIGAFDYATDANVNLTAIPDAGCSFSHWISSPPAVNTEHYPYESINLGTDNPITLTMSENKYIMAVFTGNPTAETPITDYELTITVSGQGSTNPQQGTYVYTAGTQQTITASPSNGWEFSKWILDGADYGTTSPAVVTMNSDHTLTAVFIESDPPIEPPPILYYYVNVSSAGHGQAVPSGTTQKVVGQTFTAQAIADTDYVFSHWTRNGWPVSTTPKYTVNNGEAYETYNLVAYFTANPPTEPDDPPVPDPEYYSVNIGTRTGVTTDLTGTQTLGLGIALTVNATLANNYRFNYWLYDNTAEQHGNLQFTKTETSTGQHTLLPVVQYVPPPLPDTPVILSSTNVAVMSNSEFDKIQQATKRASEKIDYNMILKKLKRT